MINKMINKIKKILFHSPQIPCYSYIDRFLQKHIHISNTYHFYPIETPFPQAQLKWEDLLKDINLIIKKTNTKYRIDESFLLYFVYKSCPHIGYYPDYFNKNIYLLVESELSRNSKYYFDLIKLYIEVLSNKLEYSSGL